MSQENVGLVKRLYAAWNRGDYPNALALIDPEIEVEGMAWTLRDGKAVRWRYFAARQDALEAAGLEE